nr:tetratricopeptide repeat protein [Acidobacteriota bacterium]
IHHDPVPIGNLMPQIPADVQTIVMKCLEKEPQRRYDSALDLAGDLQRYLDGEPITARYSTIFYRIKKRLLKNKLAFGIAVTSLLLMAGMAGLAIRNEMRTRQQAQLAQMFISEAEQIETNLRLAYMSPAHDVRAEQQAVRQHLKNLEDRIQEAGSLAQGVGNYALGRAYLALTDYDQASTHLKMAEHAGMSSPELDYALGRTLGEFFRRELARQVPAESEGERKQRLKRLEETFAIPALKHLEAYANSGGWMRAEEAAYVQGLIAFYRRDYPQALTKAQDALAQRPWFAEAVLLIGDIHRTQGTEFLAIGQYEKSLEPLKLAQAAYSQAGEISRSHPQVFESQAECTISIFEAAIFQLTLKPISEQEGRRLYDQSLSACNQALTVQPDNAHVWLTLARAKWRMADVMALFQRLQESEQLVDEALESAARAQQINPQLADANAVLGRIWFVKGLNANDRRQDVSPIVANSAHYLEQAIAQDPGNAQFYYYLGLTYFLMNLAEKREGKDYTQANQKQIQMFEASIYYNPGSIKAMTLLVKAYSDRAWLEWQRGNSPLFFFQQSFKYAQQARQMSEPDHRPVEALGLAKLELASFEIAQGKDATVIIDEVAALGEKLLSTSPESQAGLSLAALAELARKCNQFEVQAIPQPDVQPIRVLLKQFNQAQLRAALTVQDYQTWARVEELAVRIAVRSGNSPQPALLRARNYLTLALKLDPADPTTNLFMVKTYNLEIRHLLAQGKPIHSALIASTRFSEALAKTPYLVGEKKAELALWYLYQALDESGETRPQKIAIARDRLREIVSGNQWLAKSYQRFLSFDHYPGG